MAHKNSNDLLACYFRLRPLSGTTASANPSPHVQQRSLLYHLICYIVISAEALEML